MGRRELSADSSCHPGGLAENRAPPGPFLPVACSPTHTVGASCVSGLVAGEGPLQTLLGPWGSPWLAHGGTELRTAQLPTVRSAPGHCDVGRGPGPQCPQPELPGIGLATTAWEGLNPTAAGTRRGNCSWQRAQRALRSWHRHRRNSMTAEQRALCLQSTWTHTPRPLPPAFQAGRLAPSAAGEREKLLFVQQERGCFPNRTGDE